MNDNNFPANLTTLHEGYFDALDNTPLDSDLCEDLFSIDGFVDLERIEYFTCFRVGTLTYDYLKSAPHGLGQAIATVSTDNTGIVVVSRSEPTDGPPLYSDEFGCAVDMHVVMPSEFNAARAVSPAVVDNIIDSPVLYPASEFVTVVLINLDGHAEYGSIARSEFPAATPVYDQVIDAADERGDAA